MFPPVFCVPIPDGAIGSVAVFGATQIRPRVYTVAPYRILHGSNGAAMPEEAWAMDGRFGGHPSHISNDPLTLIAYHPEHGALVFEGTWAHCGTTVFSMYCGAAIPMLQFTRFVADDNVAAGGSHGLNNDWFLLSWDNHLPTIEGTRRDIRRWAQRWNPMSWNRESEAVGSDRDQEGGGSARGGSPVPKASPFPKFVADLLIRDAAERHATCPITMEPITTETAVATPCYHVFNADALASWVASGHDTCPECRSHIAAAT
jgi:hypothetical protein